MANNQINKAVRYNIIHDKDYLISLFGTTLLALGFSFLLYKGFFNPFGEKYLTLLVYVMVLGLNLIISNSLIINLSVNDRLTHRLDFILGSGISIKSYIKSYSLEMWRMSAIGSFILFYLTYLAYDFSNLKSLVFIYLTSLLMAYFEIVFMNIVGLSQNNFKFFKNLLFFATSISIYMLGTFNEEFLGFLEIKNINLSLLIIGINIALSLIFFMYSQNKLKTMKNEDIIAREGTWT